MGGEHIILREINQNKKDKSMCYNLHVESKIKNQYIMLIYGKTNTIL